MNIKFKNDLQEWEFKNGKNNINNIYAVKIFIG